MVFGILTSKWIVKWYKWVFGVSSSNLSVISDFNGIGCIRMMGQGVPRGAESNQCVSSKVRLCSPLVAGSQFLIGASLDYPQLLRLALPKTLHARISWVSFLYIFLWAQFWLCLCAELFEEIYMPEELSSTIAWRRRLGFWDEVRWTRRQLASWTLQTSAAAVLHPVAASLSASPPLLWHRQKYDRKLF